MRVPCSLSLLAALAISAGGCFRLARTSPPVERFVLGGATLSGAATEVADSTLISVGLRRLDLAPYLSTLAIVVRRDDNQIVTTGFHRWAEGPSIGVNRAVSGYIANAPGIGAVDVAPWPIGAEHDFLVQLRVSRFEGVASTRGGSGEAHLLARWEIVDPVEGSILARGITDFRADGWMLDDYEGLVSRLDNGLVTLARDVVTRLRQLQRDAATTARP